MAQPQDRPLTLERLEERTLLIADHILVRFQAADDPIALQGTTLGQSFALVPGLYEVRLTPGISVDQALNAYRRDPRVELAEPDSLLGASWQPNDSRFREQWNLRNTGQLTGTVGADVHAASAWDVTVAARRIPVAVIDSGIDYKHPDLYLNIWVNQREIPATRRGNLVDIDRDGLITFRDLNNPQNQGFNKITDLNKNGYIDAGDLLTPMGKTVSGADSGQGGWADGLSQDGDRYIDDLCGWNSNAGTNNPFDDFGHGSHIAGIVGAIGNNGVGVTGISWQVPLVPVKFLNQSGAGTISQFIAGLEWALSKGFKLSNNSWTDSGYTPILFEAVSRARAAGHIFVAAAGNNGRNTDVTPVYPANFALDNVVSVTATDRNDRLASFANWGKTSVDIAAPGVDILSTTPWNRYGIRGGTSMAAPHVTGVIAMIWALRPEWSYRQVINWMLQTADRLPSLDGKVASGRLNAAAAVRVPPRSAPLSAAGLVIPGPTQPTSTPGGAILITSVERTPAPGGSIWLIGGLAPGTTWIPATQPAPKRTELLDQFYSAGPLRQRPPMMETGLEELVRLLAEEEQRTGKRSWEPFGE
jgi:subtilisin family serine protease